MRRRDKVQGRALTSLRIVDDRMTKSVEKGVIVADFGEERTRPR
jgi:hypothetical protein